MKIVTSVLLTTIAILLLFAVVKLETISMKVERMKATETRNYKFDITAEPGCTITLPPEDKSGN